MKKRCDAMCDSNLEHAVMPEVCVSVRAGPQDAALGTFADGTLHVRERDGHPL